MKPGKATSDGQNVHFMVLHVLVPFGIAYAFNMVYRAQNAILETPLREDLGLDAADLGFLTSTFLLTYAIVLIPLGVALDRWGPRRIQVVLMVVGGLGIILFGASSGLFGLAVARGIVGIGMATTLAAALTAVANNAAPARVAAYNGIVLAIGGAGAIFATEPLSALEEVIGWRQLCYALGLATFSVAILIAVLGRDGRNAATHSTSLRDSILGLGALLRDPSFQRILPILALAYGVFIAVQGLWLAPWMEHVAHLGVAESDVDLLIVAVAMTAGLLSGGLFHAAAARLRWPLAGVIALGLGGHLVTQALIVAGAFPQSALLWAVYGYLSMACLVLYALITTYFPAAVAGRAVTIASTLVCLVGFLVQAILGNVVSEFPLDRSDDHAIAVYRAAGAVLVALEALALLWFLPLVWRTSAAPQPAR